MRRFWAARRFWELPVTVATASCHQRWPSLVHMQICSQVWTVHGHTRLCFWDVVGK